MRLYVSNYLNYRNCDNISAVSDEVMETLLN